MRREEDTGYSPATLLVLCERPIGPIALGRYPSCLASAPACSTLAPAALRMHSAIAAYCSVTTQEARRYPCRAGVLLRNPLTPNYECW